MVSIRDVKESVSAKAGNVINNLNISYNNGPYSSPVSKPVLVFLLQTGRQKKRDGLSYRQNSLL